MKIFPFHSVCRQMMIMMASSWSFRVLSIYDFNMRAKAFQKRIRMQNLQNKRNLKSNKKNVLVIKTSTIENSKLLNNFLRWQFSWKFMLYICVCICDCCAVLLLYTHSFPSYIQYDSSTKRNANCKIIIFIYKCSVFVLFWNCVMCVWERRRLWGKKKNSHKNCFWFTLDLYVDNYYSGAFY